MASARAFLVAWLIPFSVHAGYVVATNNGNWDAAATWSNGVPLAGDDVVIPSGRRVTNNVQTAMLGSLTNSGILVCMGTNNFVTGTNITILGAVTNNVNTDTNGTDGWTPDNGIWIVCTNLTINGSINANWSGFQTGSYPDGADGRPGRGPGGGGYGGWGGGGGHGGLGGAVGAGGTAGPTYGSSNAPVLPGSGGGRNNSNPSYGGGGGMVRIDVGTVTLDGTITANGREGLYQSGGGSGGSIYLVCGSMSGSGSLSANGGVGGLNGGGGGGGRIAIVYSRNNAFFGSCTVAGAPTTPEAPSGSNGTVVIAYTGSDPLLTVAGSPAAHGAPSPYPYGPNAVAMGTALTNGVTSPANGVSGVRYDCLGWQLATNGVLIDGGSTTQAAFTMPAANATLTFFWTNEYYLSVSTGLHGTATVGASGWYTNATQVQISATADTGYVFAQWTGDVPPANGLSNPLTLAMDQARTVVAQFGTASGETKTWTGNGNWTNAANWSPAGMPGSLDNAILASGNILLGNAVWVGDLVVSNTATLLVTNGWTSILTARDITIRGTVTHPANTDTNGDDGWTPDQCIQLACTNLTVTATGKLNASAKGYAGGATITAAGCGPGRGRYSGSFGGGGAYGGFGGFPVWGGSAYGSAANPNDPGSGGGRTGGTGGGLIRIQAVNGSVLVDGSLTANGGVPNYQSGGGAGGGIHVVCRTFQGAGLVSACGSDAGANGSGGGAGGRIAVIYDTTAQSNAVPRPTVQFLVTGGWGVSGYGQVGTLYFPDPNILYAPRFNGGQLLDFPSWSVDALSITGSAVYLPSGFQLVVTNDLGLTNSQLHATNLSLTVGGIMTLASTSAVYCYSLAGATSSLTLHDLLLTNASTLLICGAATNAGDPHGALVTVNGDMTLHDRCWVYPVSNPTNGGSPTFIVNDLTLVTTNSGFNATTNGYASHATNGFGPGGGKGASSNRGGGGGYGGAGGNGPSYAAGAIGGTTYGSAERPVDPGSGGGGDGANRGGLGGGLIHIEARKTVTLNGSLLARGGVSFGSGGGGGSGGGIYLTCKTLKGTNAVIAVTGGNSGTWGGGGGGGRIAILRTRHQADTNAWALSATNGICPGGTPANGYPGEPGTIFWGWISERGTYFVVR